MTNWADLLLIVKFTYNNIRSFIIKVFPFYINYRYYLTDNNMTD